MTEFCSTLLTCTQCVQQACSWVLFKNELPACVSDTNELTQPLITIVGRGETCVEDENFAMIFFCDTISRLLYAISATTISIMLRYSRELINSFFQRWIPALPQAIPTPSTSVSSRSSSTNRSQRDQLAPFNYHQGTPTSSSSSSSQSSLTTRNQRRSEVQRLNDDLRDNLEFRDVSRGEFLPPRRSLYRR